MKKITKKKYKDSSKMFHILFAIAALMIVFDGMITTPIALVCVDGAYEANLWHRHWANGFGVSYFFWSAPLTIFIVYLLGLGINTFSYTMIKKFEKPKYLRYYRRPAYCFYGLVIILFASVVVNNYGVIANGI